MAEIFSNDDLIHGTQSSLHVLSLHTNFFFTILHISSNLAAVNGFVSKSKLWKLLQVEEKPSTVINSHIFVAITT